MVSIIGAGSSPATRLQLEDRSDFSGARFMESYESKHSDQSFSSQLAQELGVTAGPLRLDSQAKYGEHISATYNNQILHLECTLVRMRSELR